MDEVLTVAKIQFSRNDIVVALEIALLERLAHDYFGFAFGVYLGGVEEVDPVVPGLLEAGCRLLNLLHTLIASVREPAAETQDGDLEAGVSKVSEQHVLGLEALALLGESLVRHFDAEEC